MLCKLGVDISRLHDAIRKKLNIIEHVFQRNNHEPVITSTYCDNHSPSSLHYQNKAIDLRSKGIMSHTQKAIMEELKMHLGDDYDVILEGNHYHIEYDPK